MHPNLRHDVSTPPSKKTEKVAAFVLTLAVVLFTASSLPEDRFVDASVGQPKVAAGSLHSLAIDDAGNVWTFGDNTYGQLGDGSTTRRTSPVKAYSVVSSRRAISVAAGDTHSLVLMSDKTVWVFGANSNGALSLGISTPKILAPAQVRLQNGAMLGNVIMVSAGGTSSAALLSDGTARVWGKDLRPTTVQLKSSGAALNGIAAISVGSSQVVLLKTDGSVYSCPSAGPSQAEPVLRSDGTQLKGISSISTGKGFALAVGRSGALYSWGSNANGVLGRDTGGASDPQAAPVLSAPGGADLSGVLSVDCGPDHVVALLTGGVVHGWGLADGGRLGYGKTGSLPYPIPLGLSGVNEIAVGGRHILARSLVGTVWAFGSNSVGQSSGSSTGVTDPHSITMTTNIWRVIAPRIKVVQVTQTSIALSWSSSDLYVENVRGFLIRWTLPDGTSRETLQLPRTVRSIQLGNLPSGANHTLRIVAIGASGAAEETPALVVQTLPAVSPSISPNASPGSTGPAPSPAAGTPVAGTPGAPSPEPSRGGEQWSELMTSTYRDVLNKLILLASILAVLAVALKVVAWRAAHRNLIEKNE
jgi:alpha-tubulin suppressor-like RCC1 family protein